MNSCFIVGGSDINNPEELAAVTAKRPFAIYCDSGLRHQKKLNYPADLIIGDFDSYTIPEGNVEIIKLPREKDDTDTMFAIKEGIRRGFRDFILVGVTGARMDHTLVNIYALKYLKQHECRGRIIDDYSEMELVGNEPVLIEESYPYFSLIAMDGDVEGVTIENAKYQLTDAIIHSAYQYATSNEVLPGKKAKVSVSCGELLLIKIRHDRKKEIDELP